MINTPESSEKDYLYINNIYPSLENNDNNLFDFNPLDSFLINDSNNIINKFQNCNLIKYSPFLLEDVLNDKDSDSFELPDIFMLNDVYKNKKQIQNMDANFKTKTTNPKTHDNENKKHMDNDVNKNIINKDNNIAIFIPKNDEKSYNFDINEKEVIFDIKKIKKNGRKPKNAKNFKGKHNKMTDDNIIRKIKARFYNNIVDYINVLYEKSSKKIKKNPKGKIIHKFIQKIISKESKVIKKEDNLNWFSLKIKDILSAKISTKYTKYKSDYNKKNIEYIYKENKLKILIDVLEKSVRNVYNDYCNDIKVEGLKTLEDDLNEIREEMKNNEEEEEIDNYSVKFKHIALNLETKFKQKRDRRNKY